MSIKLRACVYVCVCVCLCQGFTIFTRRFGTGQGCVTVLPLDQCDMHSRPEPGFLPQDHPGSGVVALWLPPCVYVSQFFQTTIHLGMHVGKNHVLPSCESFNL